jgi:hypothetical protein
MGAPLTASFWAAVHVSSSTHSDFFFCCHQIKSEALINLNKHKRSTIDQTGESQGTCLAENLAARNYQGETIQADAAFW